MFPSLREFIDFLEQSGELVRVTREVDPRYEMGAIVRKVNDLQGPALLFERVKGHTMPVLANMFGTYKRVAMAFRSPVDQLHPLVADRINRYPVQPIDVESGPIKEVVLKGDEVDLRKLPIPTWNALDSGAFITMGVQVSREPKDGVMNAGIHRMELHGPRELGLLAAAPQHIAWHCIGAEESGVPLEVAVVIGCDPYTILSAASQIPYDWDELAVAGAFAGGPIEMVPCETLNLRVPATAEIVIEGHILPGKRKSEGPFGEVSGFMGSRGERWVFEATAITHRRRPIFVGAYTGYPITENQAAVSFGRSVFLFRALKALTPRVEDCYVTSEGSNMHAVIKLRKSFDGPAREEAKRLAFHCFSYSYTTKRCIIVDSDIDIYDPHSVQWALSTRLRPDQDIQVISSCPGHSLDPAYKETGVGAKYFLDATWKYRDVPKVALPPKRWLEQVDLRAYL